MKKKYNINDMNGETENNRKSYNINNMNGETKNSNEINSEDWQQKNKQEDWQRKNKQFENKHQ